MAQSLSMDDLLFIIGSKEASIFLLQSENTRLRNELNALAVKVLPTPPPTNVLPFPVVPNGKID